MPKQYEAIRDNYLKKHVPYDKAQELAARTYNKMNPGNPLRPDRKLKVGKKLA